MVVERLEEKLYEKQSSVLFPSPPTTSSGAVAKDNAMPLIFQGT